MNERDYKRMGKSVSLSKIILSDNIQEEGGIVDYDVVICISSHNRYDKVNRLINQLYAHDKKYLFKIILLNDGSDDERYDILLEEFPDIIYIKNEKPNGKVNHWYCYNQMWEYLRNITCHAVLQMDDDFILCNDFLNIILDMFFELKKANDNIIAIAPHLWSFKKESRFESWWKNNHFIDGIGLINYRVIKNMNYEMKPVNVNIVSKIGVPAGAWNQITNAIHNSGGKIFRPENSLVYHDGNDDPQLHADHRINGKKWSIYTKIYW